MKNKKTIMGVLALTGVLAVGGTFAYLTAQTDEVTNTFTMSAGLDGDLKEPTWDGVCFEGETCTVPTKGEDAAKDFVPGRVIAKDPQVKNESKDSAYIAIKISYTGDAASYASLSTFADVAWNTTDWTFNEDHTVAYYNKAIGENEKTTPAFTNVTIKDTATAETMKNFEIKVQGFMTQSENTTGTASEVLIAAFPALN